MCSVGFCFWIPSQIYIVCVVHTFQRIRGRAVKAVDSKSTGVSPRRFESCRMRHKQNVQFCDILSKHFSKPWLPRGIFTPVQNFARSDPRECIWNADFLECGRSSCGKTNVIQSWGQNIQRVLGLFLIGRLYLSNVIAAIARNRGSVLHSTRALETSYLPGKGEPQINKCGPWWGAGHCTPLLWTTMTSSSMRARQLHHFSSRVSAFERGPFHLKNKITRGPFHLKNKITRRMLVLSEWAGYMFVCVYDGRDSKYRDSMSECIINQVNPYQKERKESYITMGVYWSGCVPPRQNNTSRVDPLAEMGDDLPSVDKFQPSNHPSQATNLKTL